MRDQWTLIYSDVEEGPKGLRCFGDVAKRSARKRRWKSAWFSTGNRERDAYLGRTELQRRVSALNEAEAAAEGATA